MGKNKYIKFSKKGRKGSEGRFSNLNERLEDREVLASTPHCLLLTLTSTSTTTAAHLCCCHLSACSAIKKSNKRNDDRRSNHR